MFQRLPRLKRLEIIFGYELSDEGLRQMHRLQTLESLHLAAFHRLKDQNLAPLAKLRSLRELTIQVSASLLSVPWLW